MLKKSLLLSTALIAVACAKSKSPNQNIDPIDKARWAGAIIVEGGEGIGKLEGENKTKFRVYICLEKTNGEEREAKATIDLNQLGLEMVHKNASFPNGATLTRKLDKLDVQLKYSTQMDKKDDRPYSKIGASVIGYEAWSVVAHTGDIDAEKVNAAFNKDPWFPQIGAGGESVSYHGADGRSPAYLMITSERLGYLGKDKAKLTTTHCEGQSNPVVVEQF